MASARIDGTGVASMPPEGGAGPGPSAAGRFARRGDVPLPRRLTSLRNDPVPRTDRPGVRGGTVSMHYEAAKPV
ncbi:MAG: hypothetical protein AMXMBFR23_02300 [Chloroflexota bacterium]